MQESLFPTGNLFAERFFGSFSARHPTPTSASANRWHVLHLPRRGRCGAPGLPRVRGDDGAAKDRGGGGEGYKEGKGATKGRKRDDETEAGERSFAKERPGGEEER